MLKFTHYYPEPPFYIEYEYLAKLAQERNIDALMLIYDQAIHYVQKTKMLKFYRNGKFETEAPSERYLPTYFGKLSIVLTDEDFPLKKLFPHFLNESILIEESIKEFRAKLLRPEFNEKISYFSPNHVNYTVSTPLEKIIIVMSTEIAQLNTYKNCWTLHGESRGTFTPLKNEEFKKIHRYFQTL